MAKADPNKADRQRLREVARGFERSRQKRDRAIRRVAAKGRLSGREIARTVGLSHTQVQAILRADD